MDILTMTMMGLFFLLMLGLNIIVKTTIGPAKSVKSVSPADVGKDYNNRWQDIGYVRMIHATIAKEKEELGQAYTVCECEACTNPPVGCGFMGCGKAGCESICQGAPSIENGFNLALPRPAKTIKSRSYGRTNRFVVDGYIFDLHEDIVPSYAVGQWDVRSQFGIFTWFDHSTGRVTVKRAMPKMDFKAESYEVYATQYEKPVNKYKAARHCLTCQVQLLSTNANNICRLCEKDKLENAIADHRNEMILAYNVPHPMIKEDCDDYGW